MLALIISLILAISSWAKGPDNTSTIEKNGMKLSWQIEGEHLLCTLSAPTTGWIAMGFNKQSGLTGTNLIMGRVSGGEVYMEDHYIVRPGMPKKMEAVGGKDVLQVITGEEENGSTQITFSIPLKAADRFHQNLQAGNTYYVLLAYSVADEFEHHSRMRTEVKINL